MNIEKLCKIVNEIPPLYIDRTGFLTILHPATQDKKPKNIPEQSKKNNRERTTKGRKIEN